MRVITERQPWAWAIIHGGKDVENRVRNIAGSYRGPVAIHAAIGATASLTPSQERMLEQLEGLGDWFDGEPIEGGVIIGVVDLIDVHHAGDCYRESIAHAAQLYRTDREAFDRLPVHGSAGGLLGRASMCSKWAEGDVHHLVLANPRPLAQPIPYKGALGLRHLDVDVAEQIERLFGRNPA